MGHGDQIRYIKCVKEMMWILNSSLHSCMWPAFRCVFVQNIIFNDHEVVSWENFDPAAIEMIIERTSVTLELGVVKQQKVVKE
jgi:hypothetical protein